MMVKNLLKIGIILVCVISSAYSVVSPKGNLFKILADGSELKDFPKTPPRNYKEKLPDITTPLPDRTHPIIVFPSYYEKKIDPRTPPTNYGLEPKLTIFAARNEYEPVVLCVWASKGLRSVNVKVEGLRCEKKGFVFPKEYIDVRRSVWYWKNSGNGYYEPCEVVLVHGPVDIPAGQMRRFWIQFWIPPNQQVGIYVGKVAITSSGRIIKTIPIKLRVLDLSLGAPSREYGFWIGGGAFIYPKYLPKYFQHMREEGFCSAGIMNLYPEMHYVDGKLILSWEKMDTFIDAYKSAGLNSPIGLDARYIGRWCSGLAEKLKRSGGKLKGEVQVKVYTRNQPPFRSELTAKLFKEIIRRTLEHGEKMNWPVSYWFAEEEAYGPGSPRFQILKYFTPLLKEVGAKTILVTHGARHAKQERLTLGDWWDIRMYNYFLPSYLKRAEEDGKLLWGYNCGGTRLMVGLYMDRLGLGGYWHWAYQWGWPFGRRNGWSPRLGWNVAWPYSNGPLSTVQMVRLREGIDDSRYLALVRKFIERAKKSNHKNAQILARKIEKEIETEIIGRLPIETYTVANIYQRANSSEELNIIRARLARMGLVLQSALKATKEAVPYWKVVPFAEPLRPPLKKLGKKVKINGNFENDKVGKLPAGWRIKQQDATKFISVSRKSAKSGKYGLTICTSKGGKVVLQYEIPQVESLINKKLKLKANVRIHRGASMNISVRQYDAEGKKIGGGRWWGGLILRVEMFRLPGSLLGIVGFEFYKRTQKLPAQLSNFCNKWLTVESRGVVSPRAKKLILSIEVGGDSYIDVDNIEIREILPPIWNVQPTRSLFFTNEDYILLTTQKQNRSYSPNSNIKIELYRKDSPKKIISSMNIPVRELGRLVYFKVGSIQTGRYILRSSLVTNNSQEVRCFELSFHRPILE